VYKNFCGDATGKLSDSETAANREQEMFFSTAEVQSLVDLQGLKPAKPGAPDVAAHLGGQAKAATYNP
jgi:hypothetical protein